MWTVMLTLRGMYKQGWLPKAFANALWMDS